MSRRYSVSKSLDLLLLLILFIPAVGASQTADEFELFGYINNERAREAKQILDWDDDLYKVAVAHSKDMAREGEISHGGSDGTQPHERIRTGGVFAFKTAENVARDINVISAHTSLMESLYHRENILDADFTHSAVGIVRAGKYLYVTELFIGKVKEVSPDNGRKLLLKKVNDVRAEEGLIPLALSPTLSKTADSHTRVQENLNTLSPPLLMNLLARQMQGQVRVNVYTTTDLERLPEEVYPNLRVENQSLGIGFKRIRGKLCEGGCYLVTLIFGRPNET